MTFWKQRKQKMVEMTPAEVVANMTPREKMKCLRQIIFNEAEISKAGIREMISDVVREQVEAVIKQSPDLFDPNIVFRGIIKKNFLFEQDVRNAISKRVLHDLKIDIVIDGSAVKIVEIGKANHE